MLSTAVFFSGVRNDHGAHIVVRPGRMHVPLDDAQGLAHAAAALQEMPPPSLESVFISDKSCPRGHRPSFAWSASPREPWSSA